MFFGWFMDGFLDAFGWVFGWFWRVSMGLGCLFKYLEMKIIKASKQEILETRQRFFTKQNRDVHRICGGVLFWFVSN